MALIISSTETKKIKYRGTNIDVHSVYARINYSCPINGKSIQYTLVPFTSKDYYTSNDPCYLKWDVEASFIQLETGEQQDIQLVHQKVKSNLESLGYLVEIVDIN